MSTSSRSFTFTNPNFQALGAHIFQNSKRGLPLARRDEYATERGVLICSPGPTLLKPSSMREIRDKSRRGWKAMAIKEAINLLTDKRIPVHLSVAMDPDASQTKKTPVRPDVVYYVASSCHPALFDHLNGCDVRVFHSVCGWTGKVQLSDGTQKDVGEVDLYKNLYGVPDVIVGGYTVVNRAVGLAKYMGFPRVAVFGAPFGWRDSGDYYAKGVKGKAGNEGKDIYDHGMVDGRPWNTRPDMLASAIDLARHVRSGEVKVVGDSMASSIARLDRDTFMRLFPNSGHAAPGSGDAGRTFAAPL